MIAHHTRITFIFWLWFRQEPSCKCEATRARRACAAGATQFFEAAPTQLRVDLNLSAWAVTGTDFKCPGWRDAIKKGNFAA